MPMNLIIYRQRKIKRPSRNLNLLLGGGAGALSVNIPASGSSSHPSIDAVASVDNSNNNFVQDLLFDTYGHVTGVVSAAVTGITSGGSAGSSRRSAVAKPVAVPAMSSTQVLKLIEAGILL